MRTAIYTRISKDTQNGAGVERQEKECRALAKRHGWDVVAICSDNSFSAYNGDRRPGYLELQDLITRGEVDAVVAWASDRLTRHPRELEDLVDLLNDTGTKVQTVTSGEYDLTTADGRAHARIIGAIARQESEKKSERIKAAKRQAAAEGAFSGGRRPYGWTAGRKAHVPEEIVVIREIADRVLGGEGLSTIAKDLEQRGIRTATGKKTWHRRSLRQILKSPATAGLKAQPDGGVIPAQWNGAYDKKTWNELCAVLDDPSRKTTHRLRSYLLTGLVYDYAGRRLKAHAYLGGKQAQRTYKTPPKSDGPRGVTIKADLVEDIVVEAVMSLTDDLMLPEPEPNPNEHELTDIEEQLDALADMYGRGKLTAGEWNAARGPLRARLEAARRVERAVTAVAHPDWARPGVLRQRWDQLTLAQKRQAIEVFVERVVIAPGKVGANSPQPERVAVVWRA